MLGIIVYVISNLYTSHTHILHILKKDPYDFLFRGLFYQPNLEISRLIRQGSQVPKYEGKI